MPHLDLRYATREGRSIFTDMEKAFLANDNPSSCGRYVDEEMYGIVAAAGARLVMNGHGGDYTLNPRGRKALARFLATGQLRRFVGEFGPWCSHWQQSAFETLKRDVVYTLLLRPLVVAWGRYRRGLPAFRPSAPIARSLLREMIAAGGVPFVGAAIRGRPSMRPSLETTLRLQQGAPSLAGSVPAALHGLVLTQPFHDKRVVELGLAVPEDLYVKNGRPRYIARGALADLYPSEMQERPPGPNDFPNPDFLPMARAIEADVLAEIDRLKEQGAAARIFDFTQMRRMLTWRANRGKPESQTAAAQALNGFLYARYVEWFTRANN